jgi:hypothetical protein
VLITVNPVIDPPPPPVIEPLSFREGYKEKNEDSLSVFGFAGLGEGLYNSIYYGIRVQYSLQFNTFNKFFKRWKKMPRARGIELTPPLN